MALSSPKHNFPNAHKKKVLKRKTRKMKNRMVFPSYHPLTKHKIFNVIVGKPTHSIKKRKKKEEEKSKKMKEKVKKK